MAIRNRLPPWHELQRLRNGREVLIRPIRPEDAQPLRAGFSLLQPDEIRQRFLYALKELSPEMADKLVRPDPKREFTIVAAEPLSPGEALVGAFARATIVEGSRDAEFAILVSRYVAGMGLGRHLMQRLVRWTRGKRLHRLHGDVPERNQPLLSLAQSLGFRRESSDTPGMLHMVLELKPAAR